LTPSRGVTFLAQHGARATVPGMSVGFNRTGLSRDQAF
jgi:hypothetical protein